MLVDVTGRKRAERERDRLLQQERALRASAQAGLALLDTLLQSAPVGLAFVDRELRIVRANETIDEIHGRPRGGSLGLTVAEAIPALAGTVVPILRGVIDGGQAVTNVEITGEVPGGGARTFLASYYPVRAPEGEALGAGVIAVEITERKRAAELQARLHREAQEAIRVRDDFLVVASHELRTPMTPLAIYLAIIQRKAEAGEPIDPAMPAKALRQVAKLTSLVNDLLDASRIQTGGLAALAAPVPFRAIVDDAVEAERVAHPGREIVLDSAGDELIVLGDERRLSQVVTNLVENAIKYSPRGSVVRVSVTRGDGEARLTVHDQGVGIPAADFPRLFDRFFRARNAPVRQYGGLGLGLPICRDIVERHRGRIWAETDLGVGSTFHVTLPLAGH